MLSPNGYTQKIYSLNDYKRSRPDQPYNALVCDMKAFPVTDVVFTQSPPLSARFLGYFSSLDFDEARLSEYPTAYQNRPLHLPFTLPCGVWADPGGLAVYVMSAKSAEETAPLSTWADKHVEEKEYTHVQIHLANERKRRRRAYFNYLDSNLIKY